MQTNTSVAAYFNYAYSPYSLNIVLSQYSLSILTIIIIPKFITLFIIAIIISEYISLLYFLLLLYFCTNHMQITENCI